MSHQGSRWESLAEVVQALGPTHIEISQPGIPSDLLSVNAPAAAEFLQGRRDIPVLVDRRGTTATVRSAVEFEKPVLVCRLFWEPCLGDALGIGEAIAAEASR